MKILHIDIEGGFGGSSRSLAKLVFGLKKSQTDIESVVLCKASGPIQDEYLANGVHVRFSSICTVGYLCLSIISEISSHRVTNYLA